MTAQEFQILKDRLAEVMGWPLLAGNHTENDDGEMCVMEAVAYIAGEPWADHPECACPVITEFLIAWNDGLPNDAERDRLLKPLIPRIVNTRSTDAVSERRSYLALDWLIRVHTPKWLDLVPSLQPHAEALRNLPEIADLAGATAAGVTVRTARDSANAAWDAAGAAAWAAARAAAWDAAWAAAGAAAWDAAWAAAGAAARAAAGDAAGDAAGAAARAAAGDAAGAAAGDAAWDAAWAAARAAAGDAAWDAAWAAAGDAAWDAAWAAAGAAARAAAWDAAWAAAGAAARAAAGDAAWDALKPTTQWLQTSALDLVERMLKVQS